MVDIPLRCLKPRSPESYNFFAIDDDAADFFYDQLKRFWSYRRNQDDNQIREATELYRTTFFQPEVKPLHAKIADLYRARGGQRPFSIIDFGGASGSMYYFMKERFAPETVRYLLIEPFDAFVDDFTQRNPDQKGIVADAEKFAAMDKAAFGDAPYDLFFASLVFCMIKPQVVKKALKKAASLADLFVIWDCVENAHGQLARDDTVIFDFVPKAHNWYFAHYFERYLADVGFELVSVTPTINKGLVGKQGWATMVARRRQTTRKSARSDRAGARRTASRRGKASKRKQKSK